MEANDFLQSVQVGNVVQIIWNGATFEPDAVIKAGEFSKGLSKVYTCGFVAFVDVKSGFITVATESTIEGENNQLFRSLVNIPTGTIESGEIYQK